MSDKKPPPEPPDHITEDRLERFSDSQQQLDAREIRRAPKPPPTK